MNQDENSNVDPQPAFNGECAFAVSLGKSDVAGRPKHRLTKEGTVYQFSNGVAKVLFRLLPKRSAKADAAWALRPTPT